MSKEKLEKPDYEGIFEKLARGQITRKPTVLSKSYLGFVTTELEAKGCITNDKLDINKLKEALEEGKVDVDIFNKPLWNEIEELEF